MAETIVTILAALALIGGCSLVAVVATTALQVFVGRLEVALGTSMLLMGTLLYAVGGNTFSVVTLVALSHAVAGGLIWYKNKVKRR